MLDTFLSTQCIIDCTQVIAPTDLYAYYLEFGFQQNPQSRLLNRRAFGLQVRAIYPEPLIQVSSNGRKWTGITHRNCYVPPVHLNYVQKMERRKLKSKAYQRHYYLTHKEPKAHGTQKRKLRDVELVVRCGFEDPEPRSKQWRKYDIIQYEYHRRGVVNWDLSVKGTLSNREEFLQQYNFARPPPSSELQREITQGEGPVGLVILPQKSLAAARAEPVLPNSNSAVMLERLGDAYPVEESEPLAPPEAEPAIEIGLLTSTKHIPYGNDKNRRSEVRPPARPQCLGTPGSAGWSQSRPVTKLKIRRGSSTETLTPTSPFNGQSPAVPMDLRVSNSGRDGPLVSNEAPPSSVGDDYMSFADRRAPSSTPSTEGGILTSPELQAELCDSSSSVVASPPLEPKSQGTSGPQTIQSFLPRPAPRFPLPLIQEGGTGTSRLRGPEAAPDTRGGQRQAILGTGSEVVMTRKPLRSRHKRDKRSAVSKSSKPSPVTSGAKRLSSREEYFQRREEYKKALDAQFKLYNKAEAQAIHHGGTDLSSNRAVQKLANAILKLVRDWGHVTQPEPSIPTLSSKKYDPQRITEVEKEYDALTLWYNEEEDRLTLGYTDDTLYYFLEDYDWSHQCQDKMIHRLQQRRSQVEGWYETWVNYGVKG